MYLADGDDCRHLQEHRNTGTRMKRLACVTFSNRSEEGELCSRWQVIVIIININININIKEGPVMKTESGET